MLKQIHVVEDFLLSPSVNSLLFLFSFCSDSVFFSFNILASWEFKIQTLPSSSQLLLLLQASSLCRRTYKELMTHNVSVASNLI